MNSKPLPISVDPWKSCSQGYKVSGVAQTADMTRLDGLVFEPFSTLSVELDFATDNDGRPTISGRVKGDLTLCCQRCLESMPFDLNRPIKLYLVENFDAIAELSKALEPMIVPNDGKLELQSLLEDEIILSLPIMPRHEPSACSEKVRSAAESDRKNPFQILSTLKRDEE